VPLVSVPSEDESIENFTKGNVKDWIGHYQSQRGVKAVIRVMTDAGDRSSTGLCTPQLGVPSYFYIVDLATGRRARL